MLDQFLSSIFAATWNADGKYPSSDMNLDDWLHVAPPTDIYVLGYVLTVCCVPNWASCVSGSLCHAS